MWVTPNDLRISCELSSRRPHMPGTSTAGVDKSGSETAEATDVPVLRPGECPDEVLVSRLP